jgi:hypothetical protein
MVDQCLQDVPALRLMESSHAARCVNPVPADAWQRVREGVA